ncbi:MAG: class I SAM-dependent methyltransferase [Deltaproteobacteria bacterium]|nr:class I SAM-dependent methyltransferase [Deltaproteobacteria bacterium]
MNEAFVCPTCGAPLKTTPDGLECTDDDESFPKLGPFWVLQPAADLALSRHRDAFLAALAETGEVPRSALAHIEAAHRHHRAEPEPLKDDITGPEEGIADVGGPDGPASDALSALDALTLQHGPLAMLQQRLAVPDGSFSRVAEIGPGAGRLTRSLAPLTEELVLVDKVPRTLWRAKTLVARDGHPPPVLVVAEADALPLAPDAYDRIVAMNVIDLLDDPAGFLERALAALTPEGQLLLTTPDPGLGATSSDVLAELVEALGGQVLEVVDGLPWLRHVSPRHRQVYLTQLLVATR